MGVAQGLTKKRPFSTNFTRLWHLSLLFADDFYSTFYIKSQLSMFFSGQENEAASLIGMEKIKTVPYLHDQ